MLISVVIVVCLTHQFVMAQKSPLEPMVKIEPEENHVFEGGVAEFNCTVTGRVKQNTSILWQYYHDTAAIWEYSATSMMVIYPSDSNPKIFENVEFSNYTNTVNSPSNEEEVFMLSIRDVRPSNDSFGVKIFCVLDYHSTGISNNDKLDTSTLVVWKKPLSAPQCKFEGDIPEIITNKDTDYSIKLTCSLDGSPKHELTWYVITEDGILDIIGNPGVDSISADRDITAAEHGIEYICHAVIAVIPDEPLTCSIIPYNPAPKISLTIKDNGEEGTTVIFCNNTGVSTPDTEYLWYINGIMLSTTPDESISIKQTSTNSTLYISDSLFSSNSAEVACEGVIPMVTSANETLTIPINEPRSDSMSIIIIAAAAAGGSFVIIIVVLCFCCFCIKRTRSDKANAKEQDGTAMTLEENEVGSPRNTSNNQVNHGDSAMIASTPRKETGKPNNHYSLEPSVSSKPGEGGIPVYALPNKNKTQLQSDQDKNKNVSPSLYDDVNVPKSNDDTISNKDAVQRGDQSKRNAEGLTYADIAITSSATGKDVSSDDVIRTESATVYSEVKM